MKFNAFLRRFPYLFALVSSSLLASTIEDSDDIDQKDVNAVREWINLKRQVTVKELGGALSISGEVRTEFQATNEVSDGTRQRGAGTVFPTNSFDVEVNVMLDYRADYTWGSIKLEFDENAGIDSGTFNKLKVERAFWGVKALTGDTYSVDVEVGRRKMSSLCDSKLQFSNFFDGAWFKYDQGYEPIGDFYIHAGVFIINENKTQFGYMGEVGIMNIGGTGFYTKYSLIDWDTKDLSNELQRHRFDFLVSQLILGYKFYPKKLQKIVQFYLAGLWNSSAHKLPISDNKRANWGGYMGVTIGELKKKGDWSFDINYQVLAAQCVPDFDVMGIGLGNANNGGFYTTSLEGSLKANDRATAGGNVNFRGFQMTLDYLITNQLDIQQSWQQAIRLDDGIGPRRRFKQYEIEFIYGF